MNDTQVDVLVASTLPISDRQVAALSLGRTEADLFEAILVGGPAETAAPGRGARSPEPPSPLLEASSGRARRLLHGALMPVEPGARLSQKRVREGEVLAGSYPSLPAHAGRRSRRRTGLAIAVAAAAAVLVAALLWQQSGRQADVELAAAEPKAPQLDPTAENGPWILADAPGWEMTETMSLGEPNATTLNQTRFSDGSHDLSVIADVFGVAPPPPIGGVTDDEELGRHPVLGHEAEIRQARESREFLADWEAVNIRYRVVSDVATVEEFHELLDSLQEVDFETYADAAPASYVAPGDQPALIDELMTDVPRPAGFDPAALLLDNRGVGEKRRDIVNVVGSAAVCGWVEHWIAATDAGDAAGAQESVDALVTFLDAPIVDEMRASRGTSRVLDHYPVLVEEFAEAMAEGRPVRLTGQGPDLEPIPGEPHPVRDVHGSLLNCGTGSSAVEVPPGEGDPELEAMRRELERLSQQPPG